MKRNDFGFIRTITGNGVMARQFERRLVCLAAGIGEKHAVGKSGINELTRQAQSRFVRKNVAGMPQRFPLRFQRRHQRRMTVPQRGNRDAAGEIDVFFALLIPNPAAYAFYRNELRGCINRQNNLIERFPGDCGIVCFHKAFTLSKV